MLKSNTKKKSTKPTPKKENKKFDFTIIRKFIQSEIPTFLLGAVVSLIGCFLFIALVSFFFTGAVDQSIVEGLHSDEIGKIESEIHNWGGALGATVANTLINKWIGIGAFIFALWICMTGLRIMRVFESGYTKASILCLLCAIITSLTFGVLYQIFHTPSFVSWGGNHGVFISDFLFKAIGPMGTGIVLLILIIIVFIMISHSTIDFIRRMLKAKPFRNPFSVFSEFGKMLHTPKQPVVNEEDTTDKDNKDDNQDEDGNFIFITEEDEKNNKDTKTDSDNDIDNEEEVNDKDVDPSQPDDDKKEVPTDNEDKKVPTDNEDKEVPTDKEEKIIISEEGEPVFTINTGTQEELVEEVIDNYDPTLDLPHYRKPTLDLLKEYPESTGVVDEEEQLKNKKQIIDTLKTYGIGVSSISATVGPTVTLYEIVPAPGVRIARIKSLEDDIALSLKAWGIRIIAPIPGKGTVGIEAPNKTAKIVSMHSIIASRKFQECKYELPIVMGKTITNEVYIADLTKMPHVLVAGATGQGKSVGLNAIITSLLYKKHPAELKFVLVDPKKVEFSIYSTIERHFLAKLPDAEDPIITDTSKVVQTLQSITHEMDMRYELLKNAHVRNIKEYNAKFKERHLLPSKGHRFLPYIVVIIDEFSDLIMTAGKEVESPIIRIAQLARAVGIHMIIATQRPSTNVITGIIKANFPARFAFRVQSMVDSRTILDCPGANQLIGRGDMLISESGDMVRVQCAFIDTPEAESICNYISEQQGYPNAHLLPEYVGEESDNGNTSSFDSKDRDPLFEEVARIIVSSQQASTSSLQRRYSIGYNRAGRIMDQLEAAGIVGPAMGGRPREVLISDMMQLENKLEMLK